MRARLGLPPRYVLTVGTIQPRKNLARLAAAMTRLARAGLPHRLVVAGKRGWLAREVDQAITAAGASDLVLAIGYVASSDLRALYSGADVFCLPSLYEGFGLPLLEAMACGVPVVAASRAALPEIAGDAALLADPFDVDALAGALHRILSDDELRRALTARGLARAADFTWERSARETLAVLRRVRDECG